VWPRSCLMANVLRTPTNEVPYCGREIGTNIAALDDNAFLLRTQCEKCGKEFLIVEGVPRTTSGTHRIIPRDREVGWSRLSLLHSVSISVP
jgi:hypothetical protein